MQSKGGVGRRLRRIYRQGLRTPVQLALVGVRRRLPTPRMHPHFLVVGAQKSGTTTLWFFLMQHALAVVPLRKEIHYFDEHYGRGMDWYTAHFPVERVGAITGESTPYYLFHPDVARRISKDLPGAKIIVLLRNPVKRAYSHFQHEIDMGTERRGARHALLTSLEAARRDPSGDDLIGQPAHQHRTYIQRGVYHIQLTRYLAHFPSEQLLVVSTEALAGERSETLARVAHFLGIDEWEPANTESRNTRSYPPLDPEIDAELRLFYEPHNQRLYDLLGQDYGW